MNEKIQPKRNITVDIIRALAIILIVQGHIHNCDTIHKFIGLFQVAAFFILSGYLFKDSCYESINSLINFVKNKLIRLCIPFLIISSIYLFLHNFFIKINFYTNNLDFYKGNQYIDFHFYLIEPYDCLLLLKKFILTILLARTEELSGPVWFLPVLFYVLVIFACINFIIKKIKISEKNIEITRLICIFVASQLGYYCSLNSFNIYKIGTILSSLLILYIGYFLKKNNFNFDKVNLKHALYAFSILMAIAVYLKETFAIMVNFYYNPLFYIFCSLLGFVFLIGIANFIKKSLLKNIFVFIGKHTIAILCLHLLAFKLITYIYIIINKEPIIRLASSFTYYNHGIWEFIYLLSGIFIPLLFSALYEYIKLKITNYHKS